MPKALADKVRKSQTFNQGYELGELLAAAELDMRWHELPASAPRQKTDDFEAKALGAMGLDTQDVPPRYRSSYFLHIWSNGYAAGYYAYLWAAVLDNDGYGAFTEAGDPFDPALASRLKTIYSSGDSADPMELYRQFRGREPTVDALLAERGLATLSADTEGGSDAR